ncbi:hypothetical protein Taro_049409, partial [Colocasia esculenta]|nr:hypothetical protein [Colocasia esculenta]
AVWCRVAGPVGAVVGGSAAGGEAVRLRCRCTRERRSGALARVPPMALAGSVQAVLWQARHGRRQTQVRQRAQANADTGARTVWQDVPVLVLVSMLAYFCFLEQLLFTDMGTSALAISLPFSCALGLLSSMIASTMVTKNFIWAYASFQFAIVILFAHVFYNMLRVSPVLSVLLSSFTGFGIAISTNSLLLEYLRWRSRRRLQAVLQQNDMNRQHRSHELRRTEATGDSGQQETGNQNQQTSVQQV